MLNAMLKEGEPVICINNDDYIDINLKVHITIGKQYEVIETYYDGDYSCVRILDDQNIRQRYLMNRFISITKQREDKINSILYDSW